VKLNPQDRVSAARIRLLQQAPFYGLLANRWTLQPDPKAADVWVDGRTLGYNPKWVESASFDALMSAIAHSAHHVALLHHLRRNGRDGGEWNKACDIPVNAALDAGGFVLPKGVIVTPGDEAKSAEECYSHIERAKDKDQGGKNKKPGDDSGSSKDGDKPGDAPSHGEVRDLPGKSGGVMDEAEQDQATSEALQDIAAIAQQAKSSGYGIPASIEAQIHKLLYPLADWREILRDYLNSLARSDYSWSRPNRRFIGAGLYLPSLQSEGNLGNIVIAVDTSISISMDALALFGGALNELLEDLNPEQVTVIYCDQKIHRVETHTRDTYPIEFNAVGRGSTSLCPPFEYVDANGIDPDVFLYFTDLGGRSPEIEPPYPVFWIDQDNNPQMMEVFGHKWGTYLPMGAR
jgi:predicted metal-dependent peptidase